MPQAGCEVTELPVQMQYDRVTVAKIAGVVALVTTAVTWGITWQNNVNTADRVKHDFTSWTVAHESYHKERAGENAAAAERVNTRLNAIETEQRKNNNFEYRLTVLEQVQANQNKALDELKRDLGDVRSDLRVVKEILMRFDQAMGPGTQSSQKRAR